MEPIRVITTYNRCEQRLGFTKHLIWRASQSSTNNLASLGKDLVAAVSQRISVTLSPHLESYIKKALAGPTYKDLRNTVSNLPTEATKKSTKVRVEKQDFYLADPATPSRRGKLVKEDWRKYPYLAVDLGLMCPGTYSLMVRGQAFLSLVPEEEKKAFVTQVANESPNLNTNPLLLSLPQKLLLIFSFLERDGDILTRLYKEILKLPVQFTDWQTGDYLPQIYRDVASESRSKARSGDDFSKIRGLFATADSIEGWKGKSYKGRGARDEAATIRLEPFVDLGLLSKPDAFAYRYLITDVTKAFFEQLINSQSIDHFLRNSFLGAANFAFKLNGKHQVDKVANLPAIYEAYAILKSPLGYAPILETCLLAGIKSITEKGTYYEISESVDVLKSLQKEKPQLVSFSVDRWGGLNFVKFNQDITSRSKSADTTTHSHRKPLSGQEYE